MTNFKKQVFSVLSAGVLVANVAGPAFASTIEISGNGAGSDSNVAVQSTTTSTVSQNNSANVTNTVKTDADTGDNKANYNTGGNVGIQTGNADVTANIANDLNKNMATVSCPLCGASDMNVKISGNGANSDNRVDLLNSNSVTVNQNNAANVSNNVDVEAETGDNKAGLNTGGDVVIKTGNAKVNVDVATMANVNSAKVGNGMSATPTPSASFWIVGNGAGSDNTILADLSKSTTVGQNNAASIDNDVDVEAETGDNDANFNTGGDVVILSGLVGGADAKVNVDNAVNFNFADVNCGCTWDVLAKIAGNGASEGNDWWDFQNQYGNSIGLKLTSDQLVGQGNAAHLNNDVDVDDVETGDNEAGYNTGAVDENTDPAIVTGNAKSMTSVSNSGNVNSVGNLPFVMPQMPQVDFSINFAALWAFFGM